MICKSIDMEELNDIIQTFFQTISLTSKIKSSTNKQLVRLYSPFYFFLEISLFVVSLNLTLRAALRTIEQQIGFYYRTQ